MMLHEVLILTSWLAPLASLLVNFVAGLVGPRRWDERWVGWTAVAGPALSFVCGLVLLGLYLRAGGGVWHAALWRWMTTADFTWPLRLHVDALTIVMHLTVTGVSTLIHAYSLGYMRGDAGYRRYFIYLNLFVFMMLLLVMADHLALMFVGWEGVGLCSYLLIAHWMERPAAATAGRKAFVVNRVGDAGFLIGIFLLAASAGVIDWEGLQTWAAGAPAGLVAGAALALFVGATGKSAQIPLYVWLPDAMEGPTPVSALIHAATMVTAGVYMVVRLHFLYDQAPAVQAVVVAVGLATALYAAVVAVAQTEMKKVLAFSTISQIGYMFVGAGLGAYVAAIFHLVTHAFFKALLFLATGNVMHATGGEQDVWRLGRLRTALPVTERLFLIGALTLAGLPPLAAFFSKEAILTAAWASRPVVWGLAWLTAGVTAFYAVRLWVVPFYQDRTPSGHPHEAPPDMRWPLYVLAGGSVLGGLLGLPGASLLDRALHDWHRPLTVTLGTEVLLGWASLTAAVVGSGWAYWVYLKEWDRWRPRLDRWVRVQEAFQRQLGCNELYELLWSRPLLWLSERVVFRFLDVRVIDGLLDGSARALGGVARWAGRVQTGNLKVYAYAMLLGLLLLLAYLYGIRGL
ncbi:MAG: NADH-quinone oxidoreductase subunit L [Acidobacteria bacterium]|nr:NADH-quinone oxidoreductase subunit L [Acidobacteriota bacterium]MDW7984401.1 NADH-quinone oxidoreductase subunit L [Acidobacteriota bacterium]